MLSLAMLAAFLVVGSQFVVLTLGGYLRVSLRRLNQAARALRGEVNSNPNEKSDS
ncbi:MAG: hypothetical protein WCO42_04985 [bacterium]